MCETEIIFFYPSGHRLTGQELASKLILELLADSTFRFKTVKMPLFNRNRCWSIIHMLCFLARVARVWLRFAVLSLNRQAVVYLNLSQGLKALLCDGLPFFLSSIMAPRMQCVISLHGYYLNTLRAEDLILRLFTRVLKRATTITVLGPYQREKLIKLGIQGSRIRVVNNTCERVIQQAVKGPREMNDQVSILYLSNLYEAKGYKDYLSALLNLSSMTDCSVHIRAVLCGKLTATSWGSSNANFDDAAWIRKMVEEINKSRAVELIWVQGAYGREKAAMFLNADIFVFPSKYKVEAQPIVLIEAMAAGCAIIASDVGEIPTMLDSNAGLVLHNCSAELLAKSILELINDGMKRNELKRAALSKYESKFSRQAYAANWQDIFIDLCKRCGEEFV